jgi:hypothetical protein
MYRTWGLRASQRADPSCPGLSVLVRADWRIGGLATHASVGRRKWIDPSAPTHPRPKFGKPMQRQRACPAIDRWARYVSASKLFISNRQPVLQKGSHKLKINFRYTTRPYTSTPPRWRGRPRPAPPAQLIWLLPGGVPGGDSPCAGSPGAARPHGGPRRR